MYFTVVLTTDETYRTEFAERRRPRDPPGPGRALRLPRRTRHSPVPRRGDRRTGGHTVSAGPIEIRTLRAPEELIEANRVLQEVWGTTVPLAPLELLTAICHTGGYVAGAFAGDSMVGASIGLLARHHGRPALAQPRHRTGRRRPRNRPGSADQAAPAGLGDRARARLDHLDLRSAGASQRVVQHRRPRRRRSTSTSRRSTARWTTPSTPATNPTGCSPHGICDGPLPTTPRDGSGIVDPEFVPTPDDVVALRRTDPAAVAMLAIGSPRVADRGTRRRTTASSDSPATATYVIGSAP